MSLLCLFSHKWDGCKCYRCGEIRNEEHKWNGCKCERCYETRDEEHKWILLEGKCVEKCFVCGKKRIVKHKWDGCKCEWCGEIQSVDHEKLEAAVRTIFNTYFSDFLYGSDDTGWKEKIQKELDLLERGGVDSISLLKEFLIQCANGQGGYISKNWWNGGTLAVKAAALLPKKEAISLMIQLLHKDSHIAEWFTYIQKEAAIQLGKIGDVDTLYELQKLLEKKPFSMSPMYEFVQAIRKLGGNVPFSAEICLVEAWQKMPNARIEYYFQVKDKIDSSWTPHQMAYLYYIVGKSAGAGFADPEYKESNLKYAFFASQIFIEPDSTSDGWMEFREYGFKPSKENAIRLHEAYPLPLDLEQARNYKAPLINAD